MSLGALPGELLEHIVHLMHAYDQAVRGQESWTSRTVESICKRRYASTSSSHGRGVHSLSLVNKRLRELTLPYLCQTVRPRALRSPLFVYRALPQAILDGVTCLDLRCTDFEEFCDACLACDRLPNLASIRFDTNLARDANQQSSGTGFGYQPQPPTDTIGPTPATVRELFQRIQADKTTRLEIGRVGENDDVLATFLPVMTRPVALTHLSLITSNGYGEVVGQRLMSMLDDYGSLETLELADFAFPNAAPTLPDALFEQPRFLYTLRVLRIQAHDPNLLAFIELSYPLLEVLELGFPDYYRPAKIPLDCQLFRLPELRHLSLASLETAWPILQRIDLSTLRTLDIHLYCGAFKNTYVDAAPLTHPSLNYPSGLRLRLSIPAAISLLLPLYFHSVLAKNDVRFTLTKHSTLRALGTFSDPRNLELGGAGSLTPRRASPSHSPTSSPPRAPALVEQQRDVLHTTVEWAARRLVQLERQRDAAGMRELARALAPVEELRVLEQL
ncbi:uncharacterized protein JCM10292_006705 [Rhodotorula paludigena]|uniref:uncharacterized protein n=1 Tax=Rhodotorula paludigena TaxID=86838 RepID=UPI00317B8F5B